MMRGTISGLSFGGEEELCVLPMPLLKSGLELYSEIFHSELILDCVLTDSLVPWHSILEHILSNKEFISFRSGRLDGWDGGLVTKKSRFFASLFHN